MDEEEARLALLNTELTAIETAIRSFDTIGFQIKGWAVTAALAIGGFALSDRKPGLLLVGAIASVGFFLIDCQFKMIQRPFIRRNISLAKDLRELKITEILKGEGKAKILGVPDIFSDRITKWRFASVTKYLRAMAVEAMIPSTFALYIFLLAATGVEALLL